jgi:predicted dehydrogenase
MSRITRRTFLERSIVVAAAAPAVSRIAAAQSDEVVRVAVIGVRGQGRSHVGDFKKSPHARVVAICDPDSAVIGGALEAVPDARYYSDIRQLLDDSSIDAVSIAMPHHWHALATVWALQAGKHVYVEKPISHNVQEGRAVVEAAQKSGKLVQHGTQGRSHQATQDAIAWLHDGGLGKVSTVRGLCYKRRDSIGKVDSAQPPPSTCDYDLWTGPARMGPLMRKNLHYDWHWDFNTGNGDIGNQGIHQMDIARWGLERDEFPQRVVSCGARLGYDDNGNTPNSQICVYDYGDQQIIFEVRGLKTDPYKTARIGVVFDGEEGYLVSRSYGKVIAYDNDGQEMKVFTGGGNHIENFLDAIRAGQAGVLNADCLEGHRSSALCHLGNISHQLGTPERLSATDAPFGEHAHANETFQQLRGHLVTNGIEPASTDYVMGPVLEFDGKTEQFVGDHAAEANMLLTREYRGPYTAPGMGG